MVGMSAWTGSIIRDPDVSRIVNGRQ